MQKNNIEVLRKILYAVESGGQVYGCQNYAAFIGAGANCSNEKAITIGAGQWYAGEAKRLLQKIQRANPAQFKKMDTQGIETDLLKKDWSTYAIATTSAKAKCIVAIINSTIGKKCQDELMDEQIVPKFQLLLSGETTAQEVYDHICEAAYAAFGEENCVSGKLG